MTRDYDKLNSSCEGTRTVITFINVKKKRTANNATK